MLAQHQRPIQISLNVKCEGLDLSLWKIVPSFQSTQSRVTFGNRPLWQNLPDSVVIRQAFDDGVHVCFIRWFGFGPASLNRVYPSSHKNDTAKETAYLSPALSRQSHTLCHVPCLCPESCAFSPVALSHLPMTRRHSQTESPAGDRLLGLLHVPQRVCGYVVHQLL